MPADDSRDGDGWALEAVTDASGHDASQSAAGFSNAHILPEELGHAEEPTIGSSHREADNRGPALSSTEVPSSLPSNLESLSQSELIALVHQLYDAVQARQAQLIRQAEHMSQLQQVRKASAVYQPMLSSSSWVEEVRAGMMLYNILVCLPRDGCNEAVSPLAKVFTQNAQQCRC
jgi:hypothetical protein